MSIIIVLKDRIQIEIEGYQEKASEIIFGAASWIGKNKLNGRTIMFRGQDIRFLEVIDADEEKRIAEEQARLSEEKRLAAEAEAKANPNPGAKPKLVVPGGKIVQIPR